MDVEDLKPDVLSAVMTTCVEILEKGTPDEDVATCRAVVREVELDYVRRGHPDVLLSNGGPWALVPGDPAFESEEAVRGAYHATY
jgi:hypothetical protein